MSLSIRSIHWEDTLPLRHAVLWPDKPIAFCHVKGDEDARHCGVYEGDQLVTVASVFISGNSARLRKFATMTTHQGKGVGSELLNHIIKQLQQEQVAVFWCDARESAMRLYQRLGMKPEGERFFKSDVPYFKMSMVL